MILGQSFGVILSFNLLVPLNSIKFCNDYIYSTPQLVITEYNLTYLIIGTNFISGYILYCIRNSYFDC